MAVTHGQSTRDSLAQALLDQIGTSGFLEFRAANETVIATLPLSATAGTRASEDVTFNAITSDTNAVGGTVARAAITTSASAIILQCDVALTNSDINMSSLVVGPSDTVACTALVYTAPV